MEAVQLSVQPRQKKGKGHNRRLRDLGQVPGVIYGKGREDIPIVIPEKDLKGILVRETGRNTIINLNLTGEPGQQEHTVMIRDIQKDPLKGQLIHADFYEISLDKKIHTQVPLVLTGEASGVRQGGILQYGIREVEMVCLPSEIPDHLEIDISSLEIGQKFTVSQLKSSEGCKIINDSDAVIVSIIAPRIVGEEEDAVEKTNEVESA